ALKSTVSWCKLRNRSGSGPLAGGLCLAVGAQDHRHAVTSGSFGFEWLAAFGNDWNSDGLVSYFFGHRFRNAVIVFRDPGNDGGAYLAMGTTRFNLQGVSSSFAEFFRRLG